MVVTTRAAAPRRKPLSPSPKRLLIFMALSIFLVESAVMTLIHVIPFPVAPDGFSEAVLDAVLLLLLLSPMLYYFLFRPLFMHINDRKSAAEALEAERDRLETVTESMGAGLAIISRDYRTLWANGVIGSLFGDVEGKPCFSTYNGQSDICPNCGVREVFEQGRDKVVHEQRGTDAAGNTIWSQIIATPIRDAQGTITAALELVVPITSRKQAEEAVEEERNRLKGILDVMPDGIYTVNRNYEIQYINPALAGQFGPVEGRRCYAYFHNLGSPCPWCKNDEVFSGKQVRWDMRMEKTGRFYDLFDTPVRNADGSVVKLEIVHDVTERKRAEQELNRSYEEIRSLSAHLRSIRERERANIAREVHDELGQVLTALQMDIAWLGKKMPALDRTLSDRIGEMRVMIDGAIETVKKIAAELRPTVLEDFGLVEAVESAVREFEKRSGVMCRLSVRPESITLDLERSTVVYRILQESLTNVMRHAQAKTVTVILDEQQGEIRLIVEDDGKGIGPDKIDAADAYGIRGMKERVRFLGGEMSFVGIPGKGTTVIMSLPRNGQADGAAAQP